MLYYEMPVPLPVRAKVFQINQRQDMSPAGSGFIQTIQRSTPAWVASYTTAPLNSDRDSAWIKFIDSLDGANNCFLAYNPRKPRPSAYMGVPAGSTNYGPNPRCIGADINASTLSLAGLGNTIVINPGDLISFWSVDTNSWWLFRSNDAPKVGPSFDIKVRPRPWINFTGSPVLRLEKACCSMKMIGPMQETDSVDSLPVYSINAVQFIDRAENI